MKAIATFLLATPISTMASAVPVTLVYAGTLPSTSTLGGASVANQPFVFTATADTANVTTASFPAGVFLLRHDSATISINGGPALTVLSASETFSNTTVDIVGLAVQTAFTGPNFLDLFSRFSVTDYDFTTSVPQITNPTAQIVNLQQVLATSGGDLIISGPNSAPGTFQATVGATAIPPPPTLLLSLAGLGLLSVASRVARRGG
ncbi:MAG: hypothetical protein AAGH74_01645 [Pseudomonadota bacterium]